MEKGIIFPFVILLCTLISLTRLMEKLSNFWETVQLDSIANNGKTNSLTDYGKIQINLMG